MTVAPYLATVVAHYRHPRNMRRLETPTHAREGVNPLCGDRLRIELAIDQRSIADAAFAASACAIAIASASLLTERLRGQSIDDALAITDDEMIAALGDGVPVARRSCATLAARVLRLALRDDA